MNQRIHFTYYLQDYNNMRITANQMRRAIVSGTCEIFLQRSIRMQLKSDIDSSATQTDIESNVQLRKLLYVCSPNTPFPSMLQYAESCVGFPFHANSEPYKALDRKKLRFFI